MLCRAVSRYAVLYRGAVVKQALDCLSNQSSQLASGIVTLEAGMNIVPWICHDTVLKKKIVGTLITVHVSQVFL